jgi:hypothetical protein
MKSCRPSIPFLGGRPSGTPNPPEPQGPAGGDRGQAGWVPGRGRRPGRAPAAAARAVLTARAAPRPRWRRPAAGAPLQQGSRSAPASPAQSSCPPTGRSAPAGRARLRPCVRGRRARRPHAAPALTGARVPSSPSSQDSPTSDSHQAHTTPFKYRSPHRTTTDHVTGRSEDLLVC